MVFADDSICFDIELVAAAPTPCPLTQAPIAPSVPDIGPLTASILASVDKLFLYLTTSLALPLQNGHWPVLIMNNHSRRILQLCRMLDLLLVFTLATLRTGNTAQSISATCLIIIQPCLSLILIANVSPI